MALMGTRRSRATEMAPCTVDAVGESLTVGVAAAELDVPDELGDGEVGVGDGFDSVGVGDALVFVGLGDALCEGGGAIELGFDEGCGAELAVDGLGAGV
jgi:hypothetical protein